MSLILDDTRIFAFPADQFGVKRSCVVMDIDGTLANADHRLHLLPKNHPDVNPEIAWRRFYEAAINDVPNHEIVALSNAMASVAPVYIFTDRSYRDHKMTRDWLDMNDIQFDLLVMRQDGDHRPDFVVKAEMLQQLRAEGYEPLFAVDDRKGVTKMFRDAGVRCLQVCEGDY